MLRPCWEVRSDGSGRGEDLSLVTVRGEGPGRARTMLARAEVTTEGTLEPGGPCGAVAGDRGGWALCLHMDRSLAANSLQERGGVGGGSSLWRGGGTQPGALRGPQPSTVTLALSNTCDSDNNNTNITNSH